MYGEDAAVLGGLGCCSVPIPYWLGMVSWLSVCFGRLLPNHLLKLQILTKEFLMLKKSFHTILFGTMLFVIGAFVQTTAEAKKSRRYRVCLSYGKKMRAMEQTNRYLRCYRDWRVHTVQKHLKVCLSYKNPYALSKRRKRAELMVKRCRFCHRYAQKANAQERVGRRCYRSWRVNSVNKHTQWCLKKRVDVVLQQERNRTGMVLRCKKK